MSAHVHLIVETLAGSATITMRRHFTVGGGTYCAEVGSVMLDPDEVLALASKLTRAAVPSAPVRPPAGRRLMIRQRPDGKWFVVCPECFPLPGAWHDQHAALDGAYAHLADEHSEAAEAEAAERHGGTAP